MILVFFENEKKMRHVMHVTRAPVSYALPIDPVGCEQETIEILCYQNV